MAALHKLAIVPDESFLRNVSPDTYVNVAVVTTAGTPVYMNVPAGAKRVIFGSTGNFAVRYNAVQAGTAAANFTAKSDGTGCEVNPVGAYLIGVTELSFDATANNTAISCTFYL